MRLTACSGIESNNLSKYTNINKEQKHTQTTEPAIAVEPVLAPVIDFNYRWPDAPIEMKELFAKEHNKNLTDYIHEYDLMNMWYAKRYWLCIDS